MKLEEIVNFFSGPNNIELKKKYNKYVTYTNEDLEFDLYQGYRTDEIKRQKSPILNAGDLVINMMTNQTAIVSPHSAGKVIPQHIVKLTFTNCGDNWYLCYLLNEAQSIKRQLYSTMEGTVLRRVTLTSFKQLELNLPALSKQQKIGELYRLLLIKEGLQKERQEKEKQVIISLLNKNDINGGQK